MSGRPGSYRGHCMGGHALAGRMIIQSQGNSVYSAPLPSGYSSTPLSPRSGYSMAPMSPRSYAYPRPGIPPRGVEEKERCASCSKDEVWSVFDAFCSMDRSDPTKRSLGRAAFFKALKDKRALTMERMRLLKRTGLHQRFRASASDVHLDEMLELSWPKASRHDLRMMKRWCLIKQVQLLVRRSNFRCDQNDMRNIFSILDDTGLGTVAVRDLVHAELAQASDTSLDQMVTFPEFLMRYQASVKARYVNSDLRRHMEQTEQRQNDHELLKGLLPTKAEK